LLVENVAQPNLAFKRALKVSSFHVM
jgi:hypothetical protein